MVLPVFPPGIPVLTMQYFRGFSEHKSGKFDMGKWFGKKSIICLYCPGLIAIKSKYFNLIQNR